MKKRTLTFAILSLALLCLAGVGCKLIMSGTFVIVEEVEFSFTADGSFYWYPVDLTGNSVWEDHKDNIDRIDMIGFSFDIQNNSTETCEFNAMFVAATGPADPSDWPTGGIPSGAVSVISGLTVPAGGSETVTYGESLGHISNLEAFKDIIMTGRFDYYGTSCGVTGDSLFVVTDGLLVITLSGSED
ncbi:MAG: hypothetical protein DRP45_01170 [Candidatus Zixiibacteriota bacterium]|nr:MAG: hypothetical protein DRP45_01170 [candidate division Zixibacteria bacterium]